MPTGVDVSKISRLVSGISRNIEISQNTLVVGALKVGVSSPTELTKAILDNLINLQNGSQVTFSAGVSGHAHDDRYYTETELGSTTNGSSGASKIGVDQDPAFTNISGANVQAILESIDSALDATSDESVKVSANDTTAGYLNGKLVAGTGVTLTENNDGSNETLTIATSITQYTDELAQDAVAAAFAAAAHDGITVTYNDAGNSIAVANTDKGTTAVTNHEAASDPHTGYVRKAGSTMTAAANLTFSGGGEVLGLPTVPSGATAAASKAYVDNSIMGVKPKQAVRVATTGNITIATALNSGDTLDGVTLADGDRVLVKDQSSPEQNGIYVVGASPARASDFDSLSPIDEINGSWVGVQSGTANGGKVFIQYGSVVTLDTDPINFTYFSDLSNLVGGDGITVSGGTIDIDHDGQGLQISGAQLSIELDGTTIQKSVSGLKVNPNLSVTTLSASGSVTGSNLSGTNTGDQTITLTGDVTGSGTGSFAATIANSAVTTIKINDDAVTKEKINVDVAGNGIAQNANGSLEIQAGDASLTVNADSLEVKRDAAGAIGLSGTGIKARVDDATIEISGTNELKVKESGIQKVFVSMVAGENINAGDVVYLSTSVAGQVLKADADALSSCEGVIGIADETVSASAAIRIQVAGKRPITGTFTAGDRGKRIYLSGTSGTGTSTAPSAANSVVFLIGHLVDHSTNDIIIAPSLIAVNE